MSGMREYAIWPAPPVTTTFSGAGDISTVYLRACSPSLCFAFIDLTFSPSLIGKGSTKDTLTLVEIGSITFSWELRVACPLVAALSPAETKTNTNLHGKYQGMSKLK